MHNGLFARRTYEVIDSSTAVVRAQASLEAACSDLDAVVSSLTDVEGESVMANAELVGLLLRVAAARSHLKDVERPRTSPPASLR